LERGLLPQTGQFSIRARVILSNERSLRSQNSSVFLRLGVFPRRSLTASETWMLATMPIIEGWTPTMAHDGRESSSRPPWKHSRHTVSPGIIVVALPIWVMTAPWIRGMPSLTQARFREYLGAMLSRQSTTRSMPLMRSSALLGVTEMGRGSTVMCGFSLFSRSAAASAFG